MNSSNNPTRSPLGDFGNEIQKHRYSFTINISPNKRLFCIGRKFMLWGDYNIDEQKDLLKEYLDKHISLYNHQYVFETTIRGEVHVHGTINCTFDQMLEFQQNVHKTYGMPRLLPSVVCKIKPVFYLDGWENYCQKDQPEALSPTYIPKYSMFLKV